LCFSEELIWLSGFRWDEYIVIAQSPNSSAPFWYQPHASLNDLSFSDIGDALIATASYAEMVKAFITSVEYRQRFGP